MIHFSYIRCEKCRYPLDWWFFSVSTFLGPETVNCKGCKETIITGRTEWAQKTIKQKAITLLMSLFYLTAGGYGFGYSFYRMNEIFYKLPEVKSPGIEQMKYHWMSGSFLVAMVLVVKFVSSLTRWNEKADAPSDENIWSWSLTFGTQMKMLILLLALYAVAGAYN